MDVVAKWVAAVSGAGFLAAALILGPGTPDADAQPSGVIDLVPTTDRSAITDEAVETARRVAAQFPETVPLTVTATLFPSKLVYAGTLDHLIMINEWMLWNPKTMLDDLKSDTESGFHNGGCTLVSAMMVHEMGHVIERARGRRAPIIAQSVYGSGQGLPLSQYSFHKDGTADWSEALAEAFQATYCGVNNATEQNLYRILVTS